MRKTAVILFTVVLAMLVTPLPLPLPASSCIPSNAPGQDACESDCCAKKSCCATSEEDTGGATQPLLPSGASKQLVIGLVAAGVTGSDIQPYPAERVCGSVRVRAHSPPPLAASCIRLI